MRRVRKSFAKIGEVIAKPHLIDMQRRSYENFLQRSVAPDEREDSGMESVFKSVFPIEDFNGTCLLEFVNYSFGEPKYTVGECIERGMTHDVPIKITVRLITFDVNPETEAKTIRDIKEQSVFLGSIPLMTKSGVFVVNGTERVIVSQLQRSPGLFYAHDNGKNHASGKLLYSARIIPVRGSWVDLEFDAKDILHVRIDRRRKFPVTTLLKALGYEATDLLRYFYPVETIKFKRNKPYRSFDAELMAGTRAEVEIKEPTKGGDVLVKAGGKIGKAKAKRIVKAGIDFVGMNHETLLGMVVASDIVDPDTGEVILPANGEITEPMLEAFAASSIKEFEVLHIDGIKFSDCFSKTLRLDKTLSTEEALLEIYRRLRPSSPPTIEVATAFFENLFFNSDTYDLSIVGRFKVNAKLGLDIDIENRTLTKSDIMEAVKYLVRLKDSQGPIDDIDHLGNRRVRTVGELVENQYRMGLIRMERAIRERMSLQETETLMPHDLINPKPITAAIKEFFGTSQLSQFMDQTNALSEVTHKRRLSALGPGGLSRERAGFEVRDVHPTHYGRICPIETPEGPNIGLIVSLASYAKVNRFGFIETPFRDVEKGKLSDKVTYMTALQEKGKMVVPAQVKVEDGVISEENIIGRQDGEVVMTDRDSITNMDVSPNQLVSVAASLIPFLENDDANRALMGSNMQRQGVPLLRTASPLVGTGMEATVAGDSGVCLLADGPGVVEEVDANRVVVRYDEPGTGGFVTGVGIYRLDKYKKSNQSTCFTQTPVVLPGQRVEENEILADGPGIECGELALGKNVTIAFMPWRGYNFEDSILVNERLLKEDTYTSLHIEVFETVARDTKLGKEEITRDIPNVSEDSLRNLDDSGVVRIGASIKPGDTMVGKVTPKGETQLSPEEKLLRAIFGEKAGDVKDTSLRVPPGVEGVIVDAKVFSRKGVEKDERSLFIEEVEIQRLNRDMDDEVRCLKNSVRNAIADLLAKEKAASPVISQAGETLVEEGGRISGEILEKMSLSAIKRIDYTNRERIEGEVELIFQRYDKQVKEVKKRYEARINRLRKGDDLPPGVIKMVKVYIATKRKLSVGDKMAGRHGNKGVVSRILPEEDMPFFEDGTSVDIVLNPLGVPSRMNVGQVLEVHLGRAAKKLGEQLQEMANQGKAADMKAKLKKIYSKDEYERLMAGRGDEDLIALGDEMGRGLHMETPVFDGALESEIRELLVEAGVEEVGQSTLYDGLTGNAFANPVTVGTMYFLKLHHLVDDKIHARSTGPYSLVTQQPLGGKAQFGGQRLGEMEVWAMEAYGAAYTLQEFLTVKSDDVGGRTKMYERIVKGNNFLEAGLPESFHVLVKELQGLCLHMELLE
ncbi:MAG: DNA-directed RNA polymerase subunit beta [Thermodesulfobacteriota bacterium]